MVNSIIYYLIGGFVVLLILGGAAFYFFFMRKRGKKFPFMYYSLDGDKAKIVPADLKIDPQNPSKKIFYFSDIDAELPVQKPTLYFEGKWLRECVQDDNGELQYLQRQKIDNSEYLSISIRPEEKALALYRYKENQRRYENPMTKANAMLLISGFILVLLIMIGVIYSTIAFANAAAKQTEVAKDNLEATKVNQRIAEVNQGVTEQLASIAAALTGNANITRQIG